MSDASIPITICVKYDCTACGVLNAECDVLARGAEDVVAWMAETIVQICADHNRRSPTCGPDPQLANIRVPVDGAAKIGGPCLQ